MRFRRSHGVLVCGTGAGATEAASGCRRLLLPRVSGPLAGEAAQPGYLTNRTGISDRPITFVATEPSRRLATEPMPRVPIAIKLQRCSRA